MSALFTRRLKQAGFTDEQAELLDVELHNSDILATKRDLKELETALRHDIEKLEVNLRRDIEVLRADTGKQIAETNQRIAETKAELIRWVVGVGILQSSLMVGVLLKVAHLI